MTGSVSQELSDTIVTMVANCNVLRARAQPPPGVLKPQQQRTGLERSALDVSFPPGALASQLFPPPGVEPLAGLTSSISSLTIGSGVSPVGMTGASSAFGGISVGTNSLSSSATAPGSPGKLFPGLSMSDSGESTIYR